MTMASPTIYSRGANPDYSAASLPRAETLYSMAEQLLERVRSCFAQHGLSLPDRQIIALAPLVVDCEQVAVLISGWQPMPPWEGMATCDAFRWCGQFLVAVTRCTPAVPPQNSTAPPTPEKMKASARIASQDAEAMIELVSTLDEIGPELTLDTPAPEGGFQTVILTVLLPAFGGLE